jgi:hypothetical protein
MNVCCNDFKKLLKLIDAMPMTKNSKESYEKKLKSVIQEEADIKIDEHKHALEIIQKSISDGLSLNTISTITGLSIEKLETIK